MQGNKILIVFSDGVTSDTSKEQATIDLAHKYGIAINSIALGTTANIGDLKPMADATGGTFVQDAGTSATTNSALQKAFDDIYASFNTGYTVRVQVPSTTAGSIHKLKIEVSVNKAIVTSSDEITYTTPYSTKIAFTVDTWQRTSSSQQENVAFRVDALVTTEHCNLATNGVVLYAKNSASDWTNPTKIVMNPSQSCTAGKVETIQYSAYIPASLMQRYGIDYYVAATDKIGFTTLYPDSPTQNPMSIPVLPNAKPVITHTAVTTATKDQPLTIKGTVKDDTVKILSVELFYKRPWDVGYYRQAVENVLQTTNNFSFTIPSTLMNDTELHYYIVATDNFGVYSQFGASYAPKIVKVSAPTSTTTSNLNWILVGTGDFDRDGYEELVWHHKTTGEMFTWEPGSSSVTTLGYNKLPTISDTNWEVMAIADLNFDEYPDILLQNKASGAIKINLMHRYFIAYTRALPTTSTSVKVAGIADFDGDGFNDIALRDLNSGTNQVWYNLDNSLKTFALPTLKLLEN